MNFVETIVAAVRASLDDVTPGEIVPRILYVDQALIIHDPMKTHVIKGRRTR